MRNNGYRASYPEVCSVCGEILEGQYHICPQCGVHFCHTSQSSYAFEEENCPVCYTHFHSLYIEAIKEEMLS